MKSPLKPVVQSLEDNMGQHISTYHHQLFNVLGIGYQSRQGQLSERGGFNIWTLTRYPLLSCRVLSAALTFHASTPFKVISPTFDKKHKRSRSSRTKRCRIQKMSTRYFLTSWNSTGLNCAKAGNMSKARSWDHSGIWVDFVNMMKLNRLRNFAIKSR